MQTATSKRRCFAPQFSLRALLVVVMLSAVGTALWYRWPIEAETDLSSHPWPTGTHAWERQAVRQVAGYRRLWGGKRIHHGWNRRYSVNGGLVSEELWSEGKKHGPARTWHPNGALRSVGAYVNNQKHGAWKYYDPFGSITDVEAASIQHWELGHPDGNWEMRDANQRVWRTLQFQNGVLTHLDKTAVAVNDQLLAKAVMGEIDDKRIAKAVHEDAYIKVVETSLGDVVNYLQESHQVPIVISSSARGTVPLYTPITQELTSLPLSVALALTLKPLGLVCDYRHGCLYIIPDTEGAGWRDETGVGDIHPRPASALAAAWTQSVTLNFVDAALQAVVERLTEQTGVAFDTSAVKHVGTELSVSKGRSIVFNLKDLSLRNAVGLLCEEYRVRVRQEGDMLVLEPMTTPAAKVAKP